MKSVKEGNIVKLTGITKHGKNRVREQGSEWKVDRVFISPWTGRWTMALDSTVNDLFWRLVEVEHDVNFTWELV